MLDFLAEWQVDNDHAIFCVTRTSKHKQHVNQIQP